MINSIGSIQSNGFMSAMRQITQTQESIENTAASKLGASAKTSSAGAPSFSDMLTNLVEEVDTKQKESASAVQGVMTGQTDNIHQAMLSMQEAGVAFKLMSEVRNKLVSSYQEIMKMQV